MEQNNLHTFCSFHKAQRGSYVCLECEETMCSKCKTDHCKSKTFNQHRVISMSEHHLLPDFVLSVSNKCDAHDRKYEFYCSGHKVACCSRCTRTYHKDCRDVNLLRNFITKSSFFDDARANIKWIENNLDIIKNDANVHYEYLATQKLQLEQDIRSTRHKINEYLDTLEKNLLDKLSDEFQKQAEELDTNLDYFEFVTTKIKEIERTSDTMKQYATDSQLFFGIQVLEKQLEEHKLYVESLTSDKIQHMELKLIIDESYTSLFKNITTMGDVVTVKHCPPTSICQPENIRTVADIQAERQTYVKIRSDKNRVITGCALLPRGQMVFVDFQNHLLIVHNNNGSYDRTMILSGQPSDIAVIDDHQIAVTLWSESKITIINTETFQEMRQINVNGKCYGIDFVNSYFLVSLEKSNRMQILNLNGKPFRELKLPIKNFAYVIQNNNFLFCADENENNLTCCTQNGDVKWTFKHKLLIKPHQIAADEDGFIFITCYESNNIIAVSPDGEESKELLGFEDGLNNPSALHISMETKQMLVCNAYSGDAHLYKLN